MSINKAIILGNVGKDPQVRTLGNAAQEQNKVAEFCVATTDRRKSSTGNVEEQTEWHNIVAWKQLADISEKYVKAGDKDLGQLVNDRTRIFHPGKNEVLGVKEIDELYGLQSPVQVIDLLGLMGDTADNIPGCPGVGPKTAEKLIQQYGSIENLLEHTGELKGSLKKKIEDNREQIVFSKFLATIKTDVPLDWDEEALRRVPVDYVALRKVFAELEFKTLTTRIIDHGEANVGLDGVPLPAAPAGSQPSLFGSEAPAPVEATPAATIKSHCARRLAQAALKRLHALLGQRRRCLPHGPDLNLRFSPRPGQPHAFSGHKGTADAGGAHRQGQGAKRRGFADAPPAREQQVALTAGQKNIPDRAGR